MELKQIQQEVSTITKETNIQVTNPKEMEEAAGILTNVTSQLRKVDAFEKKVTKPLNDALKAERARWKPMKDMLKDAQKAVRKAMSEYQTVEVKRAEAEQEKIANRVGEGKGKLKIETASKKMAEVDTPDNQVGNVSFVTTYEIEIEDIQKVPFRYLRVELRKTEAKMALQAGVDIPGLKLLEVKTPRTRV